MKFVSIERMGRIKRDFGDGGDTVYTAPSQSKAEVYHEELNCPLLDGEAVDTLTRETAEERWIGPCVSCVLEEVGER